MADVNATPSSESSSPPVSSPDGSSPPQSTEQPAASSATETKDDKVKALLKHSEEKQARKDTRFGRGERNRGVDSDKTGPSVVENGKPDDKAETKPDEAAKPDKPAEPPKKDPDAEAALRIARLAEAENRARIGRENLTKERAAFEQERTAYQQNLGAWKSFTETFPQDPVKALQGLGLKSEHLNALYWRLNEAALKKNDNPALTEKDVDARAKEIAAAEFKRLQEESAKTQQQQFSKAMEDARGLYINKVAQTFEAAKAKFPAIAALGLSSGDINAHLEAEFNGKSRVPTPDEVLAHFESIKRKQIEAAGYSPKTVEAPKADAPPKAAKTITAGWQNGSDPGKNDGPRPSQTLKESREEIRKKLDQGFYKREKRA